MGIIDFTGIFDSDGRFSTFSGYNGLCESIISLSEKARREGLLALEDGIECLDSSLMKLLLQLVVDGNDPEFVRRIGEKKISSTLHYLEEILSCAEFALLNRNTQDYEKAFSHYVKSRDTDRYTDLVQTIKQQLDGISAVQETSGVPERYCNVAGTVLSDFDENYKIMVIENHIDSVLHINRAYNEIILSGMLGVQSGDNPRVLKELLFSYTALSGRNG